MSLLPSPRRSVPDPASRRRAPALPALAALLGLTGAVPAVATAAEASSVTLARPGGPVEVTGSLRLRGEALSGYDLAEAEQSFLLTQLRLGVKWRIAEGLTAAVTLQDARVLGQDPEGIPGIDPAAVPNVNKDALAVHELYVDLKAPSGLVAARVGRQKLNLGAKRLVASLEWVNTARTWDGFRFTVGRPEARAVDLIMSRVVGVDPAGPNGLNPTGNRYADSYFHTAYYTDKVSLPGSTSDVYVMLRQNAGAGDAVVTIGMRDETAVGKARFDAEVAGQVGTFGELTHRAAMAHVGAGTAPLTPHKVALSSGYSYGSGDGDAGDEIHGTFDNLYPLNHAFYGSMDLVSLQNIHNPEAVAQITPWGGPTLRLAWQGFWLARPDTDAWYNAGLKPLRTATEAGTPGRLGSEVDLQLAWRSASKRFDLLTGYSHFFSGPYTDATGSGEDADWAFVQTAFSW